MKKELYLYAVTCFILFFWVKQVHAQKINTHSRVEICIESHCPARERYGVDRLKEALQKNGYEVAINEPAAQGHPAGRALYIGCITDTLVRSAITRLHVDNERRPGKEGFCINADSKGSVIVAGADSSGVLYGCLELRDRINAEGLLPEHIDYCDQPQMVLRGACIGLQKTTLLPGRGTYEYPITPENFPWFYDKGLWIRYLDMLADNRMNTLYLWSGHPFASLVRLKDYPYALEVDSATFNKNVDMYSFITHEADKRGIWVIQSFYNIIVSKPFAEKNHLKTQDRNRPIIPIIADYTRKSIAAFVKNYPNVGLLITLGEAMQGSGPDDVNWFSKTIIPGVKDGLRESGRIDEPPIILRAHDTYAPDDIAAAKPLYSNLYTMAKYNGEALTTYEPRGEWARLHQTLSKISPVLVENVHIMANLEPFRYGADDFIQKCVQAMHKIDGAKALHIYPQASYWDWPYTADKTDPRLLQIDRDWIWYAQWARYAWNCDRDRNKEVIYWAERLAGKYGCSAEAGKEILHAYEQSGEIAPKLLRRYGITDGNRQTLTLGMFMSELIHPTKYGLFTLLYNSESPLGEMITEYAKKDWLHEPHIGETPMQIAQEVVDNGESAVKSIDSASAFVKEDADEFNRLKNDVYCYNLLANFYSQKVRAALLVLRYKYSNDIHDLELALPYLQKSVKYFTQLAERTKDTYLYANSMQTSQRKIPITGVDGKNKTWTELLLYYQKELSNFEKNIFSLRTHKNANVQSGRLAVSLKNVNIVLLDKTLSTSRIVFNRHIHVFSDTSATIQDIASSLVGLEGIEFSRQDQVNSGTTIHFKCNQSVQILVGYFVNKNDQYLPEPELERDASANDYGQSETKIANAILIPGMPSVNVHSFSFKAGEHTLSLGKGVCLVLGFVDGSVPLQPFDAALGTNGNDKDIDWLFQ